MSTSLEDDRRRFFHSTGFDARAYDRRWLSFRLRPLTIHYPMTRGLRAALPRHDLHHILTGYAADVVGEAEIAAWELASGCGRNATAWYGNLAFMSLGVLLAPVRTLAAFVRGRSSANLYADPTPLERLLEQPTESLRDRLGLTHSTRRGTLADVALAAATSAASLVAGASFLGAIPALSLIHRMLPDAEHAEESTRESH